MSVVKRIVKSSSLSLHCGTKDYTNLYLKCVFITLLFCYCETGVSVMIAILCFCFVTSDFAESFAVEQLLKMSELL